MNKQHHEVASRIVPGTVLARITGKLLFYPCAGEDWKKPLEVFWPAIKEFWFSDLHYALDPEPPPIFSDGSDFRLVCRRTLGDPKSEIEWRQSDNGRPYRYLKPSALEETYVHRRNHDQLVVNRRRGFGQYAIRTLNDRSIGVFFHRGDSAGEGGSGVCFLGNVRRRHEPISCLFEKLSNKFADEAVIVTDGSNCRIKQLKKFYFNNEISGAVAFGQLRDTAFHRWGFEWQCVGYLDARHGPTLVWVIRRT